MKHDFEHAAPLSIDPGPPTRARPDRRPVRGGRRGPRRPGHGRHRARLARRPHPRAAQPERAPRRADGPSRRPWRTISAAPSSPSDAPSPSSTPCRPSPAPSGRSGTCAISAARPPPAPWTLECAITRSTTAARSRMEARARGRPAASSLHHRRALPGRPHAGAGDAFAVAARAGPRSSSATSPTRGRDRRRRRPDRRRGLPSTARQALGQAGPTVCGRAASCRPWASCRSTPPTWRGWRRTAASCA